MVKNQSLSIYLSTCIYLSIYLSASVWSSLSLSHLHLHLPSLIIYITLTLYTLLTRRINKQTCASEARELHKRKKSTEQAHAHTVYQGNAYFSDKTNCPNPPQPISRSGKEVTASDIHSGRSWKLERLKMSTRAKERKKRRKEGILGSSISI